MPRCSSRIAIVLALGAALLTMSSGAQAQLNVGKLKKKAEKAVSKPASKPVPATATELAGGEDPQEMLSAAERAIRPLLDMRSVPPGYYADKEPARIFHDTVKEADYPANKAKAERAVALDPGLIENLGPTYPNIVERCPESFRALTDNYLVTEINNAIEMAYAAKAKGKSAAVEALDHAEAALLVAEGGLLVLPDHPQLQALRNDARAAVEAMQKEYGLAVYTGPFHQANVGKIVFSSAPIQAGSESPAAMRTAFTCADDIYGMMYFKGTFTEVTRQNNTGVIELWADGTKRADYNFRLDGDKRAQTWLASEVIPDPSTSTTRGAAVFTKAIAELSPRSHTIRISCKDDYNVPIAEGEFTLDCSSGLDRVADVHRRLEERKVEAAVVPSAGMRDAALEISMVDACRDWAEKPVKAIITDSDWTIDRHPLSGAILSRTVNATVLFRVDGGTCKAFKLSFRQPYSSGSYGKTERYGVGDSFPISCDKLE